MNLRYLEERDLPNIKSWLKDESIRNLVFQYNFVNCTDKNILDFINSSRTYVSDLHLAIVSDKDEYMGSISLKNISASTAELVIVVRKEAMHKGYAWFGMEEMIKRAFNNMGLESVYWCVSQDNKKAIHFYDKHNFHEVVDVPDYILKRYKSSEKLKWYSVLKGDEFIHKDYVAGCKVIHIKTIPTINAGELSFFEGNHEIPFEIKRVYYISKVPEGVRRGFHAHKELKQLLFCPYGRIQVILENKNGREEIELSDPSIGILIEECTWREMLWIQKDSVLCVAASDFYRFDDYVRCYDDFKAMISSKRQS